MTVKEFETRKQNMKEDIAKLKRDYKRISELIVVCDEIIEKATLENVKDYAQKIDIIEDSLEIVEIW